MHHGRPPDTSLLPPGTGVGRVVRLDRGALDVATDGDVVRLPVPREPVAVGDWLTLDPAGARVLPRATLLARAAASGTSTTQLLAANVDVVLVCTALVPEPSMRRLERLLALVWGSGARPVVVLTKADLHPDPAAAATAVAAGAPGADVVIVSAESGDVGALEPHLVPGSTLVLLGSSGAGKSTLLNRLAGGEVAGTAAVRASDGKGRHTTTHRELFALPGGAVVIDTPGLRGVGLHDVGDGVARAFADVEERAADCRFNDCGHAGEPGCGVAAAVDAGRLVQGRVDAWHALQREAAWHARRGDARLQAQERRRWKAVHKEQRRRGNRP